MFSLLFALFASAMFRGFIPQTWTRFVGAAMPTCCKRGLSLALLAAATAHALRPLPRPLRSDPATPEAVVITHHPNGLAHVLLNRPKAINALSTEMIQVSTDYS